MLRFFRASRADVLPHQSDSASLHDRPAAKLAQKTQPPCFFLFPFDPRENYPRGEPGKKRESQIGADTLGDFTDRDVQKQTRRS